ncbi:MULTISPECIES: putative polysaccharide biosynthesis protein [Peribacillus]|uniref:putative polysaccharide biosynthesis protein n=1 Tax=Peribacillus TaxID=2675229 RepID=UPI001F4EAA06|nr:MULTISPECIES: polysaccharide biosynthesis protein [unclassified Peribacillus]MCK1986390.1 polysaccharide biosynthesis protein [Peribacillus sp. Aquil_B1]MCK2011078.1 polysaccharide biosynthesis protein [Peribacillus sp. Aquil_B8]
MAEKPYKTSNELFRGALILSAAAIIVKVLSAAYRIPYQNIAGDIGFYIYQQVYPFYGVAFTLSTLGFPVVISKLIAERESSKNNFAVKDILMTSFIVLSSIGVMMFAALFLGAEWIAGWMKDPNLAGLLRIVAYSYLLMPISSVLRGYFQGRNDMLPTASSQVAEQCIRVLTILVLSTIFVNLGYSPYMVGKGAVLGSITGGITGLVLLVAFVILREEWKLFLRMRIKPVHFIKISKVLVLQGLAFCITGLILILFQFVDSLHLYSLLRETGMGENEAKGWKGVYDRGQPLLQLGTVVANSFALALVPVISGFVQRKNEQELLNKIKLVLRVSATIGLAAAIGLVVTMKPVNHMLFMDVKGTITLAIFSLSILFTSVIMAEAAVIQSLGYSFIPVIITLVGVVSKWALNLVLVPHYKIAGAASATVLAYMIMTVLFYVVLRVHIKKTLIEKKHVLIILKSTVYMGTAVVLFNGLFEMMSSGESRLLATIQALTGVAIGAAVFVMTAIRAGLFGEEELALIPAGSKLKRFIITNRSMRNHE